jgi:hypothetical protein
LPELALDEFELPEVELPELELLPFEPLLELLPELPPLEPEPSRAIAGVVNRPTATTVATAAAMFFRLNMMGRPLIKC